MVVGFRRQRYYKDVASIQGPTGSLSAAPTYYTSMVFQCLDDLSIFHWYLSENNWDKWNISCKKHKKHMYRCFDVSFWERERDGKGQKENETQYSKQAPCWQQGGWWGSWTHKPGDHDLSWSQACNHWATQASHSLDVLSVCVCVRVCVCVCVL